MASVAPRKWTYKGRQKSAWVVRYKDEGGAHRSRQFDRKKDADDYKRKVENELEAGTHVARRSSLSVAAAVPGYLEFCDQRLSEGKIGDGRRSAIEQHLKHVVPLMGGELLSEIKWPRLERLYQELLSGASAKSGRKPHPSYARHILATVGAFLAWGARRGYLAQNPMPHARREIGPADQQKIEVFSKDEIRALLIAAEQREPNKGRRTQAICRAVLYLGAFCGLRKGEILALRWASVDFERGMLHVTNSLTPFDKVKGPKTAAGVRTVPLPNVVAAALLAWRPFCKEDERGLIFRRRGGSRWGVQFYRIVWHPLLRRAGMEPAEGKGWRHFHALRHFAGSAWLGAGATLPEVSRLLGHADVAITAKVYAHALNRPAENAPLLEGCAADVMPLQPLLITQEVRMAA